MVKYWNDYMHSDMASIKNKYVAPKNRWYRSSCS